jgi:sulfite reductase (NADPH) hemoprotein beta-component
LTDEDANFADPLYGKTYLPRKFKVAFAIPPLNDIDVFTNDCGFIAIVEHGKLAGYNLIAGGGMGMSHGNAQTYPRLADVIGFIPPELVIETAKGVVTIHRDFGDRTNRKHARLKYVIAERGVPWFREELERRLGFKLEEPRPYAFTHQGDVYGWHRQFDGQFFLGLFVENGRIKDAGARRFKTGLRRVVEEFQPELRLTPSQNIILVNVPPDQRDPITRVLAEHGVPVENQASVIRRASIACPALPTCGLALAESERTMPEVLDRIEALLAELGLSEEEIIIRMTGCPNGCARPFTAELALVGRAPGKYQLYVGGNQAGTRLGQLFRQSVKSDDIANELRPWFSRFARERLGAERFGDYCQRVLLQEQPTAAASDEKPD